MGITLANVDRMVELGLLRRGAAVLDIGSSNLYSADTAGIIRFLRNYAGLSADKKEVAARLAAGSRYDPVAGGANEAFVGEMFEMAGMEYVSFDIAAGYRTTILDLNHARLPEHLRERFDLVLNFGTTEHILNQFNCFKVIHEATRIGGCIHHSLPAIGYVDHGYLTYTARCLFDVAGYNEYEVVDFWFDGPGGHNNLFDSVRSYRTYFPVLERVLADAARPGRGSEQSALDVPDVSINIVYRKIKDRSFWGALESSTSVGAIPTDVSARYAGVADRTDGGNGIAPGRAAAATEDGRPARLVQRVSRALEPFPLVKSMARQVYRVVRPRPGETSGGAGQPAAGPPPSARETVAASADADLDALAFLEGTISRFGTLQLTGIEDAGRLQREYGRVFRDAMLILTSPAFPALSVERQVAAISDIYSTAMSGIVREAIVIADSVAWHYSRLLRCPGLTEPMACRIYDCLYGLYFAGARSLSDLRRFDSGCVVPFENWLRTRVARTPVEVRSPEPEMRICYFVTCAHFEKGNAVSPIIASLARAHARRGDRRVFVYAVQWVAEGFARAFAEGITVREFRQDSDYDRLDAIADQMRADRIDVAIADLNSSVSAGLFARRVAPLQMWVVMGFPYWSLSSLDWTLLPLLDHQSSFGIRGDRYSHMPIRQEADTLLRECSAEEIARARALLPQDVFVFSIFSRFIKISEQLLEAAARILAGDPRAHLLVVGTGDPRALYEFIAQPALAGRVTLLNRNVDLNLYGRIIDAMFDTFPFHGGNVSREVNVHGKPVLSMLTPDWERLLREERDPELLARDVDSLVAIALRLAHDREFYASRSAAAIRLSSRVTQTSGMVDAVEAAVAKASASRSRA